MGSSGVRLIVAGSGAARALRPGTPALASPAPVAPRQSMEWVALGDSYTAGVIEATGPEADPPPRDGCARTVESYPEVIRRDLGSLVSLRNVSCGAAVIRNVTDTDQTPIGRPLPPDGTDPDAPFLPVPPQLTAVSPATDLITVGVGGNSLGFGPILFRCLELGGETGNTGTPCRDEFAASIPGRLDQVREDYDQMLNAIHARAPFARVITVGYPHLVPEDSTGCTYGDVREFSTMTFGDLDWARTDLLEPLNAVIQQTAAAHGDTFVDLYGSSQGHSVCDRAGGNNWADGILSSIIPLRFGFVHPNARGHANAAAAVEDAILGG